MSIQDESFPHDELFERDLSVSPNPRSQFPHRLRQQQLVSQKGSVESRSEASLNDAPKESTATNCFVATSLADNRTTSIAESLNELPATTLDCKTNSSDPTGLATDHSKQKPAPVERVARKSISYQDIHTEYTKRRYKHVESKVSQYIANIRSEDEKRRNSLKCQRHRSMPESYVHDSSGGLQRYLSTSGANKLNESCASDTALDAHDASEQDTDMDSSAALTVDTATSATLSTLSTPSSSGGHVAKHHSSDDTGTNVSSAADSIDKQIYAQLIDEKERIQSYNEYLQLKLDEKMGENMRLKQNVDFMRVRLSTVEDQLKKQQQQQHAGRFTIGAVPSNGIGGVGWGAGRQSLQTLLYCAAKTSTATQTENSMTRAAPVILPPPPPPPPPPSPSPLNLGLPHEELYITPDTPDANNNLLECSGAAGTERGAAPKSVATIQPISLNFTHFAAGESGEKRHSSEGGALRRRSNSNTQQRQQHQQQQLKQQILQPQPQRSKQTNSSSGKPQHNSRSSHPSSGDSAIEVEVIELSSSPRRNRRKRYSRSPPLPPKTGVEQHVSYAPQGRRHSNPNVGELTPGVYSSSPLMQQQQSSGEHSTSAMLDLSHVGMGSGMRGARKHSTKRGERSGGGGGGVGSLRRRWLRFFRSCLQCSDPAPRRTLDNSALQQTYTQIPLLEASYVDSYRERKREQRRVM